MELEQAETCNLIGLPSAATLPLLLLLEGLVVVGGASGSKQHLWENKTSRLIPHMRDFT